MPEVITISGLDDDLAQGVPAQPQKDMSPLLAALGGTVAVIVLGVLIPKLFTRPSGGLGDLGIIVPCRKKDLTPAKPKSKQRWCLWTKSKSRILGRHPNKEKALKQERLIEMKKHGIPTRR